MAIPALKSCYTESFVDKNGLVWGRNVLLFLAAYHSHSSSLGKVSNTVPSGRGVMILFGLTQQSFILTR